MKTALIGSKSLGFDAYDVLRRYSNVTGVVTLDDRTDTRSRYADFKGIGAHVVSKSEATEVIRSLDADLILVAGWYWRIKGVTQRRFIGIHHSLLPKYRGGSPLVWALMRGELTVGTSLFSLTDGMDEGDLWAQARVPVGNGYIGEVSQACDSAALQLLPFLFQNVQPIPQDHRHATYCAQRNPADGEIDWTLPAREVVRFIRAQSTPYPGAFTYCGEEPVTIWRASVSPLRYHGTPGQVIGRMVMCGDGAVNAEDASVPIDGRVGPQVLRYGRVA